MTALKIAAAKLWPAYEVYSSNGSTNAQFQRHIWPVIREVQSALRDDPPEPEDQFHLRLAQSLYEMFDMRFSRQWEDLPEEARAEYMGAAAELIERMTGEPTPPRRPPDLPEIYAAGFQYQDKPVSFYAGPMASLERIRDFDPPPGSSTAFIFRIGGRGPEAIERWDTSSMRWVPV